MSKVSKSLINNKQFRNTIVSLFRSSSVKQLLSKTLTSTQSLFSNSFSSTTRVINSTHGGGAPNLCSIPASSSAVNGGTTHNIKRMDLQTSIPVRAFCLSHRIDLMGLMNENQANLIPHTPGIGNYIVLGFDNLTGSPTPPPPQELDVDLSGRSHSSYMVVFKYGSAVLFNMLDHQVDGYLKIIKRYAPGTTKDCGDSSQNYIDYKVSEKLKLAPCVQNVSNHMTLQNFNIDGICTIASVLGQSVALDYYSRLVDELISAFTDVNIGLKESGTTYNFENVLNIDLVNENLLKLLRRTRAGADIVKWFGLYERSDVAWKENSEHARLLDHLRDELKLTQRFANLDRKFKMAELNIWFVGDEMNVPRLSVISFACISCFTLIFFTPIVILPISTLDTFLKSL